MTVYDGDNVKNILHEAIITAIEYDVDIVLNAIKEYENENM